MKPMERYTRRALENAAAAVRDAPKGNRNDTLNAQAHGLGQLVGAGLNRHEAEQTLLDVARAAGLDEREARATIKSGLDAGERNPRTIEPRRPPASSTRRIEPKPEHLASPNPGARFIGTRWTGKEQPRGERFDLSFDEMKAQVEKPSQPKVEKHALPQMALATFRDNYRKAEKLEAAHGLALDYDHGKVTADAIKSAFGGWAYVAHTTWSHEQDRPRWRVLLPLARPVSDPEYRCLMRWAKLRLDGVDVRGPTQGFYVPVMRPRYEHAANPGQPLDVGAVLAEQNQHEAAAEMESRRIGSFAGMEADRMLRRLDGSEKSILTPWPSINTKLGGGLRPGLFVLVGNTAAGKSQFALQLAFSAALGNPARNIRPVPALYIGLELDRLGIVARFFGLRSGVYWSDLYLGLAERQDTFFVVPSRKGDSSVDVATIFDRHLPELNELPFYFEAGDVRGWNPERLDYLCSLMRANHPEQMDDDGNPVPGSAPFLVVLDFLQLVGGDADQLRERIGQAAYVGRQAAVNHDAVVILISSTARNCEKLFTGDDGGDLGEGSPVRFVGTGKESGEIENAADYEIALCRKYSHPPPNPDEVHLAIAKVRAGRTSWARLLFDGTEFTEPRGYENGPGPGGVLDGIK